mgnify:CR=1 FL=1
MNLKEAFRYQNKLQSFLDDAQSILDRDSNVTRVENTYLRHKVMAEAEDETVLAVPETEYYEQITDIARFLLYLLDEKGKLCLDKANLIVYSHGEYLALGKKLGTFGYSVRKKKPVRRKK